MITEEEPADDGDAEPFALNEYEESLVTALEGVQAGAGYLARSEMLSSAGNGHSTG
jgi:hypothetical protein